MSQNCEKPILAQLEKVAGQKLAVAFSGGLDSRVLLDLLAKERSLFSDLCVLHVNFGLRGEESDLDETFVRKVCDEYKLNLHVYCVAKAERDSRTGESVQEWARRVRYDFFAKFVEKNYVIALAHHEDDVAENVIMRLARGCSAGNLAGMRVLRNSYYRPLLLTSKASILNYALGLRLTHREDSSNANILYSRNYVRQEVLPRLESIFPEARRRIAATGLDAQDVSEYTRAQLLNKLNARGSCQILIPDLLSLTPGVALETLSAFLQQQNDRPVHLSRRLLSGILTDLRARDQKTFLRRYLKNGFEVFVKGDFLQVAPKKNPQDFKPKKQKSLLTSNQAVAHDGQFISRELL